MPFLLLIALAVPTILFIHFWLDDFYEVQAMRERDKWAPAHHTPEELAAIVKEHNREFDALMDEIRTRSNI